MKNTNELLKDLIKEELFQPYVYGSIIDNGFEKFYDSFVYINDLTNCLIEEDLTADFEPSGYMIYNINRHSDTVIQLKYIFLNGEVSYIEYDIKDFIWFESLLNYTTDILATNIKQRIKSQFDYFDKK